MATCLVFAGSARAANILTNGSFENTGNTYVDSANHYANANAGSTVIPGWTVKANPISWIRNDNPYGVLASAGQFHVDLTGPGDFSFAGMSQVFPTLVGGIYHLTFDMGGSGSCPGFDCTGPMTIKVEVAGVTQSFTGLPDPMSAGMHWQTFGLDFTATAASTTLTLTGIAITGGSRQYRGLDNAVVELVTAPAPVPEPEAFAMLLLGLGVVGWQARRRAT